MHPAGNMLAAGCRELGEGSGCPAVPGCTEAALGRAPVVLLPFGRMGRVSAEAQQAPPHVSLSLMISHHLKGQEVLGSKPSALHTALMSLSLSSDIELMAKLIACCCSMEILNHSTVTALNTKKHLLSDTMPLCHKRYF